MSEDEFVVLLEHAGITEVSDDGAREFLEKKLLVEWLAREGIELFGAKFLLRSGAGHRDDTATSDEEAGSGPDDGGENSEGDAADLSAMGLMMEEPRYALAERIVHRLVEREWLSPIEFDYDEDETDVRSSLCPQDIGMRAYVRAVWEQEWKTTLFSIRLSTAEAYKIYIEKDATVRVEDAFRVFDDGGGCGSLRAYRVTICVGVSCRRWICPRAD